MKSDTTSYQQLHHRLAHFSLSITPYWKQCSEWKIHVLHILFTSKRWCWVCDKQSHYNSHNKVCAMFLSIISFQDIWSLSVQSFRPYFCPSLHNFCPSLQCLKLQPHWHCCSVIHLLWRNPEKRYKSRHYMVKAETLHIRSLLMLITLLFGCCQFHTACTIIWM